MISCRDLWYTAPETCTCPASMSEEDLVLYCPHNTVGGWLDRMYRGSLRPNGRLIVTDSVLALYITELDGCTDMPAPMLLTPNGVRRLARLLLAGEFDIEPSDRLFQARYLDVLEPAGYLVRPLRREENTHAVLSIRDEQVVGLLMPMKPDSKPSAMCRAVSV